MCDLLQSQSCNTNTENWDNDDIYIKMMMVKVMKIGEGDGAEYTIKGGDVDHYNKDNVNHNFTFRPLFPWCLTTFTDPQIVRHREHLVGSPLASSSQPSSPQSSPSSSPPSSSSSPSFTHFLSMTTSSS